jgi:hypothetical protein
MVGRGGCIQPEREVIRTERCVLTVSRTNNNPFVNPNTPRDLHLESAYT